MIVDHSECVKVRGTEFRHAARGELMEENAYYSISAERLLGDAQATLDEHVTSSATGACLACGSPGPCWRRESAVAILSRSLRLPVRLPGASRPELVNARRVTVSSLPLAR
ncbi:hypothetical protein ACIA5D_23440 [Actinoplanes sp. NPDC051513]|uniref:hypothetical protein n=1 Tax=Actinoplanes sp. NPDC051513 TaxID=3363908 RepID=UPI003787B9DD